MKNLKDHPLVWLTGLVVAIVVGTITAMGYLDKHYVRLDNPTPLSPSAGKPKSVKLADGTQICWGQIRPLRNSDSQRKRTFETELEPFASNPVITLTIHPPLSGNADVIWRANLFTVSTTNCVGNIIAEGSTAEVVANQEIAIDYIAIGKAR